MRTEGMGMKIGAKLYVGAFLAAGFACIAYAMVHWTCADPCHYICHLAIALVAAGLKVYLPGIPGTMSVSYVFVLSSMIDFSYPETVVVACLSMVVQSVWRTRTPPKLIHALFNVGSLTVTVSVSNALYHITAGWGQILLSGAIAATGYFFAGSLSIAAVVALTESKNMRKVWQECYMWTFPYYLVGAAIAALISVCNHRLGWETTVLALPVVYVIFRSYRLYLGKLEAEKLHAEQIAALHLRTIEALALAIEAKDDSTHDHLQRVQIYAVELAKKMELDETQIQALRAGSILHDIGKLAVPEHIISKPGKLTAEEFEKMKIHPIVGAEILERVQFPYDVVPVVRAHHEKWNGSGYPDGLKGEEIPLGARILATVDCLDALASDRQYRRALPLEEAMTFIVSEAGISYDPSVVKILQENYREWEELARARGTRNYRLSKRTAIPNGKAPAAGLEAGMSEMHQPEFLASIAAARQEAQMLYELTQELGNSLNLHETLSVLDSRLHRLVPYDAIAVYVRKDGRLIPQYVSGENARVFSALQIPVGQGLSGWVAETAEPIVSGNPSVEFGYLNDPTKFTTLRSALAIPLENAVGLTGVLTLYHLGKDAFTRDHLRVLLALKPKLSLTIENAMQYQQAAISATIDGLTALPNARSLFLHLDAELARCQRTAEGLAVLVCDLDGFKQVNDRFGHLVGNQVLQLVAAGLQKCCRSYDYVARMGGDEFVLVLPGFQRADLVEKLRVIEEVAIGAGLKVCGERLLNISVGAAFCPENGTDAEDLLAGADRRMYLTKRAHKELTQAAAGDLAALSSSLEHHAQAPALPIPTLQ
ncbi:MAG: HD domain-containing phosphohydrolase [Bryobacteraceae bacterium]|jgi:diguanylate cyclase (GGDEF)-like protein/putative nucleotidyltransferase with HDIG domain